MIYNQEDMPYTEDGVVPDIIVNPHAIPSRMTIGQLMECILGKACIYSGSTFGDATPFNNMTVEDIGEILEKNGIDKAGNEVMYNAFNGEQMNMKIFIGPTYYQRLKHMTIDKIHCLREGHDVLTNSGWKPIEKVTLKDKIATLKDGKIVYENPTSLHHYDDYKGKMYRLKSENIDLDVTLNHRMWVKKSECDTYKLEKAEDIIGENVKYKRNGELGNIDYQFILPKVNNYGERKMDMKYWITFIGYWISNGWVSYNENCYNVYLTAYMKKQRDILFVTLKKLGFAYSVSNNDKIIIENIQLWKYLKVFNVKTCDMFLPNWVWELSKHQCQILVNVMTMVASPPSLGEKDIYYTTSRILADDFMRLCLHAGWSCNLKSISNNNIHQLFINKNYNEPLINYGNSTQEEIYDFYGSVYCISVPSEVFYVRKNGFPVWTGNSRSANGPVVLLTRQPAEGQPAYDIMFNVICSSALVNTKYWLVVISNGNTSKLRGYPKVC